MHNKILLNQVQQSYYLCLPAARDRQIFHSVFAYDALLNYCCGQSADFTLQAYCLFQDEIHLLIHAHQDPALSMDKIMLNHSQWHQQTLNEPGYLFQDQQAVRVLVQNRYLSEVVKAIHQLPVQRRMCATPALYAYSSYADYLDQGVLNARLDKTPITTMICAVKTQRSKRIADFMQQPCKLTAQLDQGNHPYYRAFADAHFITQLLSQYPTDKTRQATDWVAQWDKTLVFLSQLLNTDEFTCLHGGRNSHLADSHYLLAWLYHHLQGGPIEVAATSLQTDVESLRLNINAIHLHHPARFLRYITQSWNEQNQQFAA